MSRRKTEGDENKKVAIMSFLKSRGKASAAEIARGTNIPYTTVWVYLHDFLKDVVKQVESYGKEDKVVTIWSLRKRGR